MGPSTTTPWWVENAATLEELRRNAANHWVAQFQRGILTTAELRDQLTRVIAVVE